MTDEERSNDGACSHCGVSVVSVGLVERVAAAMWESRWGEMGALWAELVDEHIREWYREQARAAVAAMPTGVPVRAVGGVSGGGGTDDTSGHDEDGLTPLERDVAALIYDGVLGQLRPGSDLEEAMAAHFEPRTIAKDVAALVAARSGGTR